MDTNIEHLDEKQEPFLITINTLLLFVNGSTFNTLLIIKDEGGSATLSKIKEVAEKEGYLDLDVSVNTALELLHFANLIRLDGDKYHLVVPRINDVQKAVKIIGKYAKGNNIDNSKQLYKRIKELVKITEIMSE